jgi:hypothetical protein
MGTEAVWVPYALAALATGATTYNTINTARRQDSNAAQGIFDQQQRQREADTRLNQELAGLETSSPEDERKTALDRYLQQLRTSKAQIQGGTPVVGANERYGTDVTASQAGVQNYGEQVSDLLSRIFAAGEQRRGEGYSAGRTASDVAGISRNAEGDAFLNRLRASQIRRNPWIDAGAQLAGASAGAAASGAGSSDAEEFSRQMARTGAEPVTPRSMPWAGRVPNPAQRFG